MLSLFNALNSNKYVHMYKLVQFVNMYSLTFCRYIFSDTDFD